MGVRIPRIKLHVEVDKDDSFGELNFLSLGYGLHQAWVYATMFGAVSVFGETALIMGTEGTSVTLQYLVSIFVLVATLLIVAANDQQFLDFILARSTLTGAGVLACAGTVLLVVAVAVDLAALEALAGILTGLGSAVFVLLWGTAFAHHDTSTIVLNTTIAIPIGVIIYAIPLQLIPAPVSGLLTAVIPIAEIFLLRSCMPQPYTERDDMPVFSPLPINRGKFLLRFGVPVGILGLALGVLRQMTLQSTLSGSYATQYAPLLLACLIAVVIMLITLAIPDRGDQWNRLFRPLIPIIVVLLLIVPFGGDSAFISALAIWTAYLCFEALMWAFFGTISQRFRLTPIMVFGLGRGVEALGIFLGSLVPLFAGNAGVDSSEAQMLLTLSMLVCLVVAYALLPREHEMEAIVIPCPAVRAISNVLENDLIAPLNGAEAMAAQAASAEGPAAEATAAGEQGAGDAAADAARSASADAAMAAQENTASEPPEAAGTRVDISAEATEEPGEEVPEVSAEARAEAEAAAAKARSTERAALSEAARQAMYKHPANARLAGMSVQPASAEEVSRQHSGRFRKKCEAVSNTYLLSNRESEVLFFLAKGHNAAYIQEKLYISEGTAKTHIRHIYRKLDVHTQQDLMKLVENTIVDD